MVDFPTTRIAATQPFAAFVSSRTALLYPGCRNDFFCRFDYGSDSDSDSDSEFGFGFGLTPSFSPPVQFHGVKVTGSNRFEPVQIAKIIVSFLHFC